MTKSVRTPRPDDIISGRRFQSSFGISLKLMMGTIAGVSFATRRISSSKSYCRRHVAQSVHKVRKIAPYVFESLSETLYTIIGKGLHG